MLRALTPGARSEGLTTALLLQDESGSSLLGPAVTREENEGRKVPTGPFADQLVPSHWFCVGVETQPPLPAPGYADTAGKEEQEQSVN